MADGRQAGCAWARTGGLRTYYRIIDEQRRPSESVEQARSRAARPFYLQLWFLVLLAMAAGMALGALYPDAGVRMAPLGDAFIKAIRVLIAPIIFCTVVHGIAGMASMAKVGGLRSRR